MLELITKALATWRISLMLVTEDGPNDSIIIFRHRMQKYKWSPLFCIWCTSMWVAPIINILPKAVYTSFALSGLAIFAEETFSWLEHNSEL